MVIWMRNKWPRIATLSIVMLMTAFVVPGASLAEVSEGPHIVCADSMLADFTRSIVGDLATVDYIRPAGVCPAHFDARPSDTNLVADADVIVQLGWEGWLNDLITSTGNSDVDLIKCMGLDEWNVPEGAKAHVDRIAEGLVAIMPDHAATMSANVEAYKAEIDAKASELLARVVAEGVTGKKVICMEWQERFLEWLGFDVVRTYAPPESLSVKDQLNITEVALAEDVVMVIDNLQSGTEFGAHVAAETGVSHVIVTNFPSAYPNTDTFLDMLEYNTDKLIDGAKTYEYKLGDIANLESQVKDLEFLNTLYLTMAIMFMAVAVLMGVVHARSRSRGK